MSSIEGLEGLEGLENYNHPKKFEIDCERNEKIVLVVGDMIFTIMYFSTNDEMNLYKVDRHGIIVYEMIHGEMYINRTVLVEKDLDISEVFLNGSTICGKGTSECDLYEMNCDSYSEECTWDILFDHNNIPYFGNFRIL